MVSNTDFEKARDAYEALTVEQRVELSNERNELEGSPWRAVENLPYDRLGAGLANQSIRVIPIQEFRLSTSKGTRIFLCLSTLYLLGPIIASIYFAIHLKQPWILLTIVLQFVAFSFVGVPAYSTRRYLFLLIAVILGLVRGFEDLATLLIGIPTCGAFLYRFSDNFKDQEYLREIVDNEELFNNEVNSGRILVQVDSSRFKL